MYLTASLVKVVTIPMWDGLSPTNSPSPFLDSFCVLLNYCGIASKWSLPDHLDPSYPYPLADSATNPEKVFKRPFYLSHPSQISWFSARLQSNWLYYYNFPCCSKFHRRSSRQYRHQLWPQDRFFPISISHN